MLRAAPLIGLCLFVLASCEKGSDRPEDTLAPPGSNPAAAAAPASTQTTSINLGSDVAGDLRKRAEGGDVQAMLVLGRFYESRNTDSNRTEAAKWYKKAAATGDASAAEALRSMERRASAASHPATGTNATASSPSPSFSLNLPEELNTGDTGYTPGTGAGAATGPATGPTTAAAADNDPIDPTKTRWKDLVRIIDTKSFLTSIRSTDEFKFLGGTASPDRSISLFAAGQSPDALEGVTAIIRVRNKLDPGSSDRVAQMATIAAFVTRDNVSKQEMIQWVKAYLTTGKSTEPILRNGWRIIVSGPAAEGVRDDHDYLGAAVLIEMKK
jgi:hypothetical protein